jgi:hypothetical protein
MALTGAAAYGMYPRDVALPEIVCALNRAGFKKEDICMVLSPAHSVAAVVRDARIINVKREDSAISAAMIGWLSEFGAVVIPSVGFFIRSRAFFHALVIEQEFGTLCGGSRTLAGLGFSDADARRLGQQLGDSGVLVYVACSERATAEWATELMRSAGAPEAASFERARATRAPDFRHTKDLDRASSDHSVSYALREIPSVVVAVAEDDAMS